MPFSSSNADRPVAIAVESQGDEPGTYAGVSDGNRRWTIIPIVTGWRLEFRDPGDQVGTYAGSHRTLQAARIEAARTVSLPSPQAQLRRSVIGSRPHDDWDAPAATDAGQPPSSARPAKRSKVERGAPAPQTTRRAARGRRRGDDRRQQEADRRRGGDRRCRDEGFEHGNDRRHGDDRRGSAPAARRAPAL